MAAFLGSVRGRITPARALGALFAAAVVFTVFYPLAVLVQRPLANWSEVWAQTMEVPNLGQTAFNTVWLAVSSVLLALVVGIVLAYSVSVLPPRLAVVGALVAVFPMLVPALAAGIGWVFMLSPDIGYINQLIRAFMPGLETGPFDVYTVWAIIFVPALYVIPYVFLFTYTGLRSLDQNMRDAGRVCGASWFSTQRRIVLPALRPAIWYAIVIMMLILLGQFVMVLLFGRAKGIDVLTTEMFRAAYVSPFRPMVAAVLAFPLLIAAVALVYVQSKFIGRLSIYSPISKGVGSTTHVRRWPILIVAAYSLIAIVPPMTGLAITALSPFWSANIDVSTFSLKHFSGLLSNPRVFQSARNSLVYASIGTAIGLAVSTAAAVILVRGQRRRLTRLLDLAVNLPLGLPAILYGLAVLLSFALGVFGGYGSRWVFILAYVVLLLPQGVRLIMSGLTHISRDMESAARVSGAGVAATTARILLPLLRKSLAAAGLVMFVIMLNEFSASVMLATGRNQVLMTQLYSLWEGGIYPQVAALALIVVTLSVVASTLMFVTLGGGMAGTRTGWLRRRRRRW